MIPLQRAALKYGARSPWLRAPRSRAPQAHRNSSNSTPPKDSTSPATPKDQPPRSPNEVIIGNAKAEPVDIPIQLWYHRLGPVSSFFSWFHRSQEKRPYTVQVCTTLITYLCGDLLAQDIGGELYDPTRTLRMLTIGALASIPGYKWYVSIVRMTSQKRCWSRTTWHTAHGLTKEQVPVSREKLQFLVQGRIDRYQGHGQPDGFHARLQHLLLRHAGDSNR